MGLRRSKRRLGASLATRFLISSQPQSQALSPFPPVPQRKLKEENKRNTGIEVGFLPGALGDVIAVICAPATSLTSVTGIDSFGTIGISR